MTDEKKPRKPRRATKSPESSSTRRERAARESDESERALGRAVAIGIPTLTVVAAATTGFVASLGSALLVLVAGALVGTIGLLWASVRTLSGDAPLAAGLEVETSDRGDLKALLEEKRRALRALKDLEGEHALGKIDDEDYETFAAQYRAEAKRILKAIDDTVAPYRARAEEIAEEYLGRQGLSREGGNQEVAANESPDEDGAETSAEKKVEEVEEKVAAEETKARVACKGCGASNETDAAFCKQCGTSMRAKTRSEEGDVPA